jgi:hypothetical protein
MGTESSFMNRCIGEGDLSWNLRKSATKSVFSLRDTGKFTTQRKQAI